MSAQYLLNQWLDFYQIFMNTNLDITNNWLDFGDLDLNFKVTAIEKLKIHGSDDGGGGGGRQDGGVGGGRGGGVWKRWTSFFSENTVTS